MEDDLDLEQRIEPKVLEKSELQLHEIQQMGLMAFLQCGYHES